MEEVEDRVVPSWHAMTPEACIEELKVVENIRRTGLTSAQAAARLEEYGPNQLSEKRKVTLLEKNLASSKQCLSGNSGICGSNFSRPCNH